MPIPYAFASVTAGEGDPNLPELSSFDPENAIDFLMEEGNMKGKYLGACLDSCRWGGMNSVMWPTDIRGLMGIIQKWRDENDDNSDMYHVRGIDELYDRFDLPHKNHDSCPRDEKHSDLVKDKGDRTRCGHRTVRKMRPNFVVEAGKWFDGLSQLHLTEIYEEGPHDPSYYDENDQLVRPESEWEIYLSRRATFDGEEPTEEVVDVCYAILNDGDLILPFENVLRRMDLAPKTRTHYCNRFGPCYEEVADFCAGHEREVNEVIFPFDGWDLAFFLQRWKEQCDNPPWFAEKPESWSEVNRQNFVFISSDD